MKYAYCVGLLSVVISTCAFSTPIQQDTLQLGWYVLPWERVIENKPCYHKLLESYSVTVEDIVPFLTHEKLASIKLSLPERITEEDVNSKLMFEKYFKIRNLEEIRSRSDNDMLRVIAHIDALDNVFQVIQQESIDPLIDLQELFFENQEKFKGNLCGENEYLRPRDIYFIFFKNSRSQNVEAHISNHTDWSKCQFFCPCNFCLCCGAACFVIGVVVVVATMCHECFHVVT